MWARSACSPAISPRRLEFLRRFASSDLRERNPVQLIGTTYGGDGESTFAVPDLRGRLPLHQGPGFFSPERRRRNGHIDRCSRWRRTRIHDRVDQCGPGCQSSGKIVAQIGGGALPYIQDSTDTNLNAQAVTSVGSNLPHTNIQPFLCVDFIISLFGIFPSPT